MADPQDQGYEEIAEETEALQKKKFANVRAAHVGVHSSGFRDFLLSPELNRAISDAGFEHPSQVQQECIPQALLGTDVICQGKSGLGKTAVFVISILQQVVPVPGEVHALVLAPTRELAYQICAEFIRFGKYLPLVKCVVVFGGFAKSEQVKMLKNDKPTIVVGCPGRVRDLIQDGVLDVTRVKYFVMDEVDRCLQDEDMVKDIKKIVDKLPANHQSLLFSATMPQDMRAKCKAFTKDAVEVMVDDDKKLTLHGLKQFYCRLEAPQKTRKLVTILDNFKFNQLVVFVNEVGRAQALETVLTESGYPAASVHSRMDQQSRIKVFSAFKAFTTKILVATDLFARGIDVERVNIVVNYDMAGSSDTYLHRVGRAGRFGTKGLAISFIATDQDRTLLAEVQNRFEIKMDELPAELSGDSYIGGPGTEHIE